MDIYDKPSPEECLEHHGIKGQKWGVRRTPEQLGHLKNAYRTKASTAGDHYERAIKNVAKYRNATTKREKRQYAGMATYQYAKALKKEKELRPIARKLKWRGIEIARSPKNLRLQQEAGDLFVKKCLPRRIAEYGIEQIELGAQVVARTVYPDLPWEPYMVVHGHASYKIKEQQDQR